MTELDPRPMVDKHLITARGVYCLVQGTHYMPERGEVDGDPCQLCGEVFP